MTEYINGDILRGNAKTAGPKTSRKCPSCNPDGSHEDRFLYIISAMENSVTLECLRCAYTEHLPFDHVPEVRNMNNGNS